MRFLATLLALLLVCGSALSQPPPFSPASISGLEHWILPDRDAVSSSPGDPDVLITPGDGEVIEYLLAGQQVARTISGILAEVPPYGGQIWPADVDPGDVMDYGTFALGVLPGGRSAVRFDGVLSRYYWQFYYDLSTHVYLHDGSGCFVAILLYPTNADAYQEVLTTGADVDSNVGLSIAYNGTDERMELRVGRGASGFVFSGNTGTGTVPLDAWTAIGFRFKSTSPRVSAWVSTTQVVSSGVANSPVSSDHSTFLQMSSAAHRFTGDLGELLVYHSAPSNPSVNNVMRYLER